MVITMRFSPKCPESLQPFPMLLLWKLIRVIMEEEKIPPAVLGVCIPRIQPATHGYSIIVNQKEEHRYVMNDIMNTFLMGWPLLLELIHPLGNAMPMELRVTVQSSILEQLTHRVSKITDCDGGIHSQMHNEALSLRHRKMGVNSLAKMMKDHKHTPQVIKSAARSIAEAFHRISEVNTSRLQENIRNQVKNVTDNDKHPPKLIHYRRKPPIAGRKKWKKKTTTHLKNFNVYGAKRSCSKTEKENSPQKERIFSTWNKSNTHPPPRTHNKH